MNATKQWETLADEAIADAGEWKAIARQAQSERDALRAALEEIRYIVDNNVQPTRRSFRAYVGEIANAALQRGRS